MAETDALTLAFVSTHPADAARVLDGIPAKEAAVLFARLPARAAAPALVAMLPSVAARIVASMEDQPALNLLTAAGVQGAVSILRHVADARRKRLIDGLSTATAVTSRLLLGYPEDAVGAWVDPEIIVLPPATTAEAALLHVRNHLEEEAGAIYVAGKGQRLLGIVDLQAVLRAPDNATLDALMRLPEATLPAVMPLRGAADHPSWKLASALPVVERGERLIGVLHSTKLAEVLANRAMPEEMPGDGTMAGLAARSYWDTVSGLVRTCLGVLPQTKRVLEDKP